MLDKLYELGDCDLIEEKHTNKKKKVQSNLFGDFIVVCFFIFIYYCADFKDVKVGFL